MSDVSTRVPLIAGNWKMNKTLDEARELATAIKAGVSSVSGACELGVFPSATTLATVVEALAGTDVVVGGQNMHSKASGAATGETSAAMIKSCGATAVILGHSERRHDFGESDEFVGKKVEAALAADLTPILCVGETQEEREANRTMEVVDRQLETGIAKIEDAATLARVIIAYEPVWAIGTGLTASPEQAQEVHAHVRGGLRKAFEARGGNAAQADATRILYGGSMKPSNARDLLSQEDVDGGLVGGASLEAESFIGICEGALPE